MKQDLWLDVQASCTESRTVNFNWKQIQFNKLFHNIKGSWPLDRATAYKNIFAPNEMLINREDH